MYEFQVGGNGNCAQRDAGDGGVYDLVEKKAYEFDLCLVNSSGVRCDTCDYRIWGYQA